MIDWSDIRSRFPALADKAYLNTAGGGVMTQRTADAALNYYRESVEMGDIGWDRWVERAERDRSDMANMIGCKTDQVAFLPNASLGFNILALSLGEGSRIQAVKQEFPSCTTPFLRAGADVRFLQTPPDGSIDLNDLDASIQQGVDAFVVSSVQFANGYRADLTAISKICRRHDALLLVDATQSIGAFPMDMSGMGIDALVFSGYKWATAGYGNAVLATGDRWPAHVPPLVGWRSARDAYALENDRLDMLPSGVAHELGHPPFPGLFTLTEALRQWSEIGLEAVSERVCALADSVVEQAQKRHIPLRSSLDSTHRSGIILLDLPDAAATCTALKKQEVWTSARDGGLRVSVHAYNDAHDVGRLFEALDGRGM